MTVDTITLKIILAMLVAFDAMMEYEGFQFVDQIRLEGLVYDGEAQLPMLIQELEARLGVKAEMSSGIGEVVVKEVR